MCVTCHCSRFFAFADSRAASRSEVMAEKSRESFMENDPLVEVSQPQSKFASRQKTIKCTLLLLLIVVAVIVIALGVGIGVGLGRKTTPLYKSIKISNLMGHLHDLQNIANEHPTGSRAIQHAYNESAEMVYKKLIDAGYENVTRQPFKIGFYEDLGNSSFGFSANISGVDISFEFLKDSQYSLLRYSGSTGDEGVNGELNIVEGSGCEASDYVADTVALVNYDINETDVGCSLFEIAVAAESANVVALVMARMEDDPTTSPPTARIFQQTVDDFSVVDLPLLGATYQLGQTLRNFLNLSTNGTVDVSVVTYTSVTMWDTYNILAYTNEGADDSIVVVGSHLDSVTAGPGIDDNGSGSSANLEMALQVAALGIKPFNKVLFAFWGAEELGLMGSYHFVNKMKEEESIWNYALNLNFDMIGSPNYIRQIYNGAEAENPAVREASETIQNLFEYFFKSKGLDYQLAPFNGRSDYGPFIEEGVDIPAGGLFTGADVTKNIEERSTYGGLAGAILDPCYHQYCDTIDNINQEAFLQMAQAAANVSEFLMMLEDLREFLESS